MAKQDISVRELVDMVRRGELRLPELQRQYVWTATRVRDLLDSLYRGYPSGQILVWDTDDEVPEKDLAIEQGHHSFASRKLLLDGQQRLTSLAAVLSGHPVNVKNRVKPIDIAFNLDHPDAAPLDVAEVDEDDSASTTIPDPDGDTPPQPSVLQRVQNLAFVVATNALLADPRWVRVTDIFDDDKGEFQLLQPLGIAPDDPRYEKYSRRIRKVRAIERYSYVMQILGRDLPYEEIAEIFVRVNSLGVKLRSSDLAMAQITARWPNSLPLFEAFAEECEKHWFTLDLGLLIRTMVVFATHQSRFGTVTRIPVPNLKSSWEEAKDGLRFAVNFLRQNAGIEDETLLSSPFLMVPIAVFAVLRRQNISEDEERRLLHWLYIAHANGHYSGSAESTLDRDLSALFKGGGPGELVEILHLEGARFTFDSTEFAGRGGRNPLFSLSYLALKRAGAKDWHSGLGLSLSHSGAAHRIQVHHIFPQSVLRKANYELGEINEIANFAFIGGGSNRAISDKSPEVYMPKILEARGAVALKGQLVPNTPELWKVSNYRAFLAERRALLAECVNEFVAAAAAAAQSQFDVGALVGSGESERLEFKETARLNTRTGIVDRVIENAVVRTVAGFMNSSGGMLVVGVNDAGIVVGLEADIRTLGRRQNLDGYEQALRTLLGVNLAKERCASVVVTFPEVDGTPICVLQVPRSPQPVFVGEGASETFYIRSGNTSERLGIEAAHNYIREHFPG